MPTTSLGIPYPAVTDPATVPAHLQALAEKIDDEFVERDGLLIPNTLVDAKGDLLVGSAADTLIRKPVGANGTFLKADSAQAGGVTWASASGAKVLGYAEFTGDVAVSAGTEAAPTTVVSLPSITFDGTTPVEIEFYCPDMTHPVSATFGLSLWITSGTAADLGRLFFAQSDASQRVTPQGGAGGRIVRRFTPTSGAKVYAVRGFRSASTFTLKAGAGGAGVYMPGFIICRESPT